MARSSSKRNSARARASSVLPTPVGPRKMNEPIGRLGSFKPAAGPHHRLGHRVTASSWPMTRLCSSSSRCSSFCDLAFQQLATPGCRVQRLTTAAMSSSSTSFLISAACPVVRASRSSSALASGAPARGSSPYFSSAAAVVSRRRSWPGPARCFASSSCLRSSPRPARPGPSRPATAPSGPSSSLSASVSSFSSLRQPVLARRRPSPSSATRARSPAA